jgi:hypothetical protein
LGGSRQKVLQQGGRVRRARDKEEEGNASRQDRGTVPVPVPVGRANPHGMYWLCAACRLEAVPEGRVDSATAPACIFLQDIMGERERQRREGEREKRGREREEGESV